VVHVSYLTDICLGRRKKRQEDNAEHKASTHGDDLSEITPEEAAQALRPDNDVIASQAAATDPSEKTSTGASRGALDKALYKRGRP